MLLHSRGTSGQQQQRQPTDINALAARRRQPRVSRHARARPRISRSASTSTSIPPPAPIDAVPQDLMRAFLNIANNACYAAYHAQGDAPTGSTPHRQDAQLGDGAVELRIRDNGDGIPDDVRARDLRAVLHDQARRARHRPAASRSVTTSSSSRHCGRLSVETERGPIHRVHHRAASTAQAGPTGARMSAKILVVDDEPDLELLITQRFRRQIRDGRFTLRLRAQRRRGARARSRRIPTSISS